MKSKIPVLMVLFITTVLMLSTAASAATSSRLHDSSVSPGEQFTVTVNVAEYGLAGKLVETVPAGFTIDGSTHYKFDIVGQDITFFLFGDTSIQYTVTAAGSEGTYDFNGELSDFDKDPSGTPGVTSIEVVGDTSGETPGETPSETPASNVSATRDMPATVEPGEVFTVSMTASDYGTFGKIVEELPVGFSFVGSPLDVSQVDTDSANNSVIFLLLGESSFEYTVMAGSEGAYIFDGNILDEDKNSTAVSGDTLITVDTFSPSSASATRDLPATVEPGETFTVSMTASDYGTIGNIVEMLPPGFTYVNSTLDPIQVVSGSDSVMFLLLNDASFEYTVMAPLTEGTYQFSGLIEDEDKNTPVVVAGDVSVDVEADSVVVTPPTPDENVSLDMGWNFISVPCALENSSVDNVLAGVSYDALTYYNAETGIWEPVTDFVPLKGYWIHVTAADQSIMLDALEPAVPADDTPSFPLSMPVYEGWNAIGFTDKETCLSAELTLMTIDGSYSNIWGAWDPATNSYEYYGHNDIASDYSAGKHVSTQIFEMCPYQGYWVYITQDDVLSAAS